MSSSENIPHQQLIKESKLQHKQLQRGTDQHRILQCITSSLLSLFSLLLLHFYGFFIEGAHIDRGVLYPIVVFLIQIKFFTFSNVQKQLSQVLVIWSVTKIKASDVTQHFLELFRKSFSQKGDRKCEFFLHNFLIFFLFSLTLHTLPRKTTSQKIHEDVDQAFNIISPALLNSQMGVDRGISSSPCQIFIIPIGNMSFVVLTEILLGQPEVNHVYFIIMHTSASEEVIWFDISMKYSSGMDKLDQLKHFQPNHDGRLQAELTSTHVEHFLEGRPQIIHYHHITVTLTSNIIHLWNIYFLSYFLGFDQFRDELGLVQQLRPL